MCGWNLSDSDLHGPGGALGDDRRIMRTAWMASSGALFGTHGTTAKAWHHSKTHGHRMVAKKGSNAAEITVVRISCRDSERLEYRYV